MFYDVQCPTTIVPFFGDQPFWGERVHARGLGPPPIPVDQFTRQKLVDAIKFMMLPEVSISAILLVFYFISFGGAACMAYIHLKCYGRMMKAQQWN